MKNILLVVMLFISGLSIAQHLPTNVWAVRSVVPEGDTSYPQTVNRYLTTASGDLCHPGYNIGEILSYTKLNATADNRVEIGTDLNNLTPYVGVGNWRSELSVTPQRGFYNYNPSRSSLQAEVSDWTRFPTAGDPVFCNNEITSISNVRISAYNDQFERLHFSYNSLSPTRVRVIVSGDAGIDRDNSNGAWRVPIRWVENGGENTELVHTTEAGSGSYSVLVPKREVGTVYRLNLSPSEREGNLGHRNHVVEDVVPGAFITNIHSRELQIVIASNSPDGSSIWIDRISREGTGRDADNFYSRFGRNSDRFEETASRAGGRLKRYRVRFYGEDLRPYEAIRVDYNKGGHVGRIDQLNGPIINFTWVNNGARNRDDSNLSLRWRLDLPPGWSSSRFTNTLIRFYSDDGFRPGAATNVARVDFPNNTDSRRNASAFVEGQYSGGNWRWHDNEWELGVSLDYEGRRYRIKLEDHVSHNSGRPESGPREGGLRNGIRSRVTNTGERGGSHGGSINYNNSYGCSGLLDHGCYRNNNDD